MTPVAIAPHISVSEQTSISQENAQNAKFGHVLWAIIALCKILISEKNQNTIVEITSPKERQPTLVLRRIVNKAPILKEDDICVILFSLSKNSFSQ